MAAVVVHKEEEIIIRLNDSASVLDAKMTAIQVALENASETRDNIKIHTDTLTAVNILNNRKLDLNTITRTIRDATSRLTREANYKPDTQPILEYRVTRMQTRLQREAYNLIEYTLQLTQALSENKQG